LGKKNVGEKAGSEPREMCLGSNPAGRLYSPMRLRIK
jgi:hypothetical protein